MAKWRAAHCSGEVRKGLWTAEEDAVLINYVEENGPGNWSSLLSKGLLQRDRKSCRLRWVNQLRPGLKHGEEFSAEEERIVVYLHAQLGNKWAKIATHLSGRTNNDVKNFWNKRQKRLPKIQQAEVPNVEVLNYEGIPFQYNCIVPEMMDPHYDQYHSFSMPPQMQQESQQPNVVDDSALGYAAGPSMEPNYFGYDDDSKYDLSLMDMVNLSSPDRWSPMEYSWLK